MSRVSRKSAEEARNELPSLLDAAEQGRSTIITRRGRPVAALAPIDWRGTATRQRPLLSAECAGRGLWGADNRRAVRRLRDEWSR